MTARTKRSAAVKAAIYCSMLSETVKIFDLVFVSWGYFNMKLHCKNKKVEQPRLCLYRSTLLFGSLLARLYKHIHIYSEKVKNRAYYYKEMKNRVKIALFAAYAVENDSECICYTA